MQIKLQQPITDQIDFIVILLDMAEFSLQNTVLHTKLKLRYVTNPFLC